MEGWKVIVRIEWRKKERKKQFTNTVEDGKELYACLHMELRSAGCIRISALELGSIQPRLLSSGPSKDRAALSNMTIIKPESLSQ